MLLEAALTVVVTKDAFQSKIEIPIDLGDKAVNDTIPYETKWVSATSVAVSYSQVTSDGKQGVSRIVIVDVESGHALFNLPVSQVAVHTYAGGAAIGGDGHMAVYSPVTGGLVRKNLDTGNISVLVENGNFSSPWLFTINGRPMVAALKRPRIKTTRDFSADIIIMPLV